MPSTVRVPPARLELGLRLLETLVQLIFRLLALLLIGMPLLGLERVTTIVTILALVGLTLALIVLLPALGQFALLLLQDLVLIDWAGLNCLTDSVGLPGTAEKMPISTRPLNLSIEEG